jgi:hypothetical protein
MGYTLTPSNNLSKAREERIASQNLDQISVAGLRLLCAQTYNQGWRQAIDGYASTKGLE